ncbi:DMT family transporter [Paracoccus sp. p3-h83]|uniref:DMT family transporter n=1 Tax=Paracoccus sp. p3-h83 TaxID=3342805 RepID=UPI0035BB53DB
MHRPPLADWLILLGLALIWGASFANIRLALTGFGPLTVAALRIAIGAVALLIATRAMGQRLPPLSARRDWAFAIAIAVLSNSLPFALLSWAQGHVASGFAGITMAAGPLFTLILAAWLLGAGLRLAQVAGIALGATGVVVLIGPAALSATSGAPSESWARLACLGVALSYSMGSILTRRAPPMAMPAMAAAVLSAASVISLGLMMAIEGLPDFAAAPPAALASVVYLGLFPTGLATLLMIVLIRRAGPNFVALSNYQIPLWSVAFGALIFHERLPASFLLALGLILAGLALSNLRQRPRPA